MPLQSMRVRTLKDKLQWGQAAAAAAAAAHAAGAAAGSAAPAP